MKTRRIPIIQANDWIRLFSRGVFKMSALTELTVTVIGLIFAKAWSQSGMVSIGTKIELAKIRGNTQTNPATWAVSELFTSMPMVAEIQEKANPRVAANNRANAT